MKNLICLSLVSTLLMTMDGAEVDKSRNAASGADVTGIYSAFPISALQEGKPMEALLWANLGGLLSDDATPRAEARGKLVAVQISQTEDSLLVKMYDESGGLVLDMMKPFWRELLDGCDVVCVQTSGTLGEGVEGGRKSRVVGCIRMKRDHHSLVVDSESVQTFPRWLWFGERKYTHRSTFVFMATQKEPNSEQRY